MSHIFCMNECKDLINLISCLKIICINFQIQDKLEEPSEPLKPVRLGNLGVVRELEERCRTAKNSQARELLRILQKPHFKVRPNF